ncbi:MAG TPA: tyrosine-type recombinase/integrase [Myxococcaceae bacterium]|nr:tyrosine-type recombinase/integrase [Myxococcaceae bacterium]
MRQRKRVFSRGSVLYIRFRDADGNLVRKATNTDDPRKAEELAIELEAKALRQRRGLEPLPAKNGGGTLGDLMLKWGETLTGPSANGTRATVAKHVLEHEIARLTLQQLRPSDLVNFLADLKGISAATKNHVRGHISRAFNTAALKGWWHGANPVDKTKVPRVPVEEVDETEFAYLTTEEIRRVCAALAPKYRPRFAVSVFCALRKGELHGLRRKDVNLRTRRLTIARSWDRVPKNKKLEIVPIPTECSPWFEVALKDSEGHELLFPGPDGKMFSRDVRLAEVLRRAMVKAGIVDHWKHYCRKHGCDHEEQRPDSEQRTCPKHPGTKLWAKGVPRTINWHATRHTAATLHVQAGASQAVVQRLLRHSTPKQTARYTHLRADWLGGELERLSLGIDPAIIDSTSTQQPASSANDDGESRVDAGTSAVQSDNWPRSSTG